MSSNVTVYMSTIFILRSLKREGHEFKADLGYLLRPCLKTKQIKRHKTGYSGLGLRERTNGGLGTKGGYSRGSRGL